MDNLQRKIQQVYDTIAQDYANKRYKPGEKMKIARLYLKKGMRILDLGCGHGRFYEIIPPGVEYVGLDISKKLLEIAKKRYPQGKFIYGDITYEKIWRKLGKFDAVFALAVYHHLMDRKSQKKVTNLAWKYLKENGLLMVTALNLWKAKYWPYHAKQLSFKKLLIPWHLSDGRKITKSVKRPFYSFTPKELKKLMSNSGFKIEKEFFTHGKGFFDAKEFGLVARKPSR